MQLKRNENSRLTEQVSQCLVEIEQVLRQYNYWQQSPPPLAAFASEQPFFLDTMAPGEWLQWVLIPRLQQLITQQQPLPAALALTAYFEQALPSEEPIYSPLMTRLQSLDLLFYQG